MAKRKVNRIKKCKKGLEVSVLKCFSGYYIGTFDEEGPYCRLSEGYYPSQERAEKALEDRSFAERDCIENNHCNGFSRCF